MTLRDGNDGLDPNAVAYREYVCNMPDGSEAVVAVSLGNPARPDGAASAVRDNSVVARGRLEVRGSRRAPAHAISWAVEVVVAGGDGAVDDELQRLLVSVLRTFLRDVRDGAPDRGRPAGAIALPRGAKAPIRGRSE